MQLYCEAGVLIFIALAFALCLYICARMLRSTAAVAQALQRKALRLGNDDAVKLSSDCIDATVDLRWRVYWSALTVFITFVLRGCYSSMAAIGYSGSCAPYSSSTAHILGSPRAHALRFSPGTQLCARRVARVKMPSFVWASCFTTSRRYRIS